MFALGLEPADQQEAGKPGLPLVALSRFHAGISNPMNPIAFGRGKIFVAVLACLAASMAAAGGLSAAEVLMKDGRLLRGKLGKVAGLADLNFFAADDAEQLKLIVFFDDDLRRTFVPQRQIQEVRPDSSTQIEEKFHVRQRAASSGPAVRTVGPIVRHPAVRRIRPPHRRHEHRARTGGHHPRHHRDHAAMDEGGGNHLHVGHADRHQLDPPRRSPQGAPAQAGDAKSIDQRKRIARFFLQAERFKEAREELEAILSAYPDNTEVKEQLAPTIRSLRQLDAERLLGELKLRRRRPARAWCFRR